MPPIPPSPSVNQSGTRTRPSPRARDRQQDLATSESIAPPTPSATHFQRKNRKNKRPSPESGPSGKSRDFTPESDIDYPDVETYYDPHPLYQEFNLNNKLEEEFKIKIRRIRGHQKCKGQMSTNSGDGRIATAAATEERVPEGKRRQIDDTPATTAYEQQVSVQGRPGCAAIHEGRRVASPTFPRPPSAAQVLTATSPCDNCPPCPKTQSLAQSRFEDRHNEDAGATTIEEGLVGERDVNNAMNCHECMLLLEEDEDENLLHLRRQGSQRIVGSTKDFNSSQHQDNVSSPRGRNVGIVDHSTAAPGCDRGENEDEILTVEDNENQEGGTDAMEERKANSGDREKGTTESQVPSVEDETEEYETCNLKISMGGGDIYTLRRRCGENHGDCGCSCHKKKQKRAKRSGDVAPDTLSAVGGVITTAAKCTRRCDNEAPGNRLQNWSKPGTTVKRPSIGATRLEESESEVKSCSSNDSRSHDDDDLTIRAQREALQLAAWPGKGGASEENIAPDSSSSGMGATQRCPCGHELPPFPRGRKAVASGMDTEEDRSIQKQRRRRKPKMIDIPVNLHSSDPNDEPDVILKVDTNPPLPGDSDYESENDNSPQWKENVDTDPRFLDQVRKLMLRWPLANRSYFRRRQQRRIPKNSVGGVRVSTGIIEDFYLNLLDWSCQNVIAICSNSAIVLMRPTANPFSAPQPVIPLGSITGSGRISPGSSHGSSTSGTRTAVESAATPATAPFLRPPVLPPISGRGIGSGGGLSHISTFPSQSASVVRLYSLDAAPEDIAASETPLSSLPPHGTGGSVTLAAGGGGAGAVTRSAGPTAGSGGAGGTGVALPTIAGSRGTTLPLASMPWGLSDPPAGGVAGGAIRTPMAGIPGTSISGAHLGSASSGLGGAAVGVGHGSMIASEVDFTSVRFSPEGCRLALGLRSGAVQLWDVEAGRKLRDLDAHAHRVGTLDWLAPAGSVSAMGELGSAGGSRRSGVSNILTSGSRDKTLVHHDIRMERSTIATMDRHRQEICRVAWKPTGLQDLATVRSEALHRVQQLRKRAAEESTDDDADGTRHCESLDELCDWDFERAMKAKPKSATDALAENAETIYDVLKENVSLSALGAQPKLASGGNDNKVYIWEIGYATPVVRLASHTAAVKALSWAPFNAPVLASGGGTNDRAVRIWDLTTRKELVIVETESQVCNLFWSPVTLDMVTSHGYTLNQINVWQIHKALTQPWNSGDDCEEVTASGDDHRWRNPNTDSGVQISPSPSPFPLDGRGSLDSSIPAAGVSGSGPPSMTLEKLATLTGHTSRVLYLAPSPDGSQVATAAGDGTVRLWSTFCDSQEL